MNRKEIDGIMGKLFIHIFQFNQDQAYDIAAKIKDFDLDPEHIGDFVFVNEYIVKFPKKIKDVNSFLLKKIHEQILYYAILDVAIALKGCTTEINDLLPSIDFKCISQGNVYYYYVNDIKVITVKELKKIISKIIEDAKD